jgi:hypothetical protein
MLEEVYKMNSLCLTQTFSNTEAEDGQYGGMICSPLVR